MFGRSLGQLKTGMPETITSAILVSGSTFLQSEDDIKKVRRLFNADAYDMESYGYWIICQHYRLPFSAIRAVTDAGDTNADQTHVNFLTDAAKKASAFTLQYLKNKY
jgi:nucleoside phosphorylase